MRLLLVGLSLSLWQMNRAITAEGQARTNEQTANRNLLTAQANERKAIENERQTRLERDAKSRALDAEKLARQD